MLVEVKGGGERDRETEMKTERDRRDRDIQR